MLEARDRSEWDRAAPLLVILANAHRDPAKKPTAYQLGDFHPYVKREPTGLSITPATIDRLKILVRDD